jgi:hypothetical protein
MRDMNLQGGAFPAWRTGLRRRGAKRVLKGGVYTSGGIDRRLWHRARQQIRPVTAPPHRVVNRASFTGATSRSANLRSYVPTRLHWQRGGIDRDSGRGTLGLASVTVRLTTHALARPAAVRCTRVESTPDRVPHGVQHWHCLPQSNTPCWRVRKQVTVRQSSVIPANCPSKDNIGSLKTNIGSPNPQKRQLFSKVGFGKCRYHSVKLRGGRCMEQAFRRPKGERSCASAATLAGQGSRPAR